MTAVQKEIASSESTELKAGTAVLRSHRAEPFPQLGFGPRRPGDVAGITQQRLDLTNAAYIKQFPQRRPRRQVVADKTGPGPAQTKPRGTRVGLRRR